MVVTHILSGRKLYYCFKGDSKLTITSPINRAGEKNLLRAVYGSIYDLVFLCVVFFNDV